MIAATFRHMASRDNDPQLHTHAVVANMTRNRSGERRSVEPTLLRRNRRVFGAWYRNDLARRLRDLGYELTPTTVGGLPNFEISGWSRMTSIPYILKPWSTVPGSCANRLRNLGGKRSPTWQPLPGCCWKSAAR